jgi:hypothetical protein
VMAIITIFTIISCIYIVGSPTLPREHDRTRHYRADSTAWRHNRERLYRKYSIPH